MVLNAESLLLLQALEGAVDQAFADVEPCTFAPGECLIKEGQPADGLILISSGVVKARWRGQASQQAPLLGPGSMLGDLSYLLGGQARATVEAMEQVEALRVPCSALNVIIEKDPAQGLRLFRCLAASNAQRLLTQTHAQVREGLVGRGAESPMPERLASAVLRHELAECFDTLVHLTGSLFPAASGAMPAADSPALQALRLEKAGVSLFSIATR